MAEILFKAIDATHVNPEKDSRGCYKAGDPIYVASDNHTWGSQELIPPSLGGKFFIVKIPGRSVEQLQGFINQGQDVNGNVTHRRLWRLVISELPIAVQTKIWNEGSYTANWGSIRSSIQNKLSKVRA